MENRNDVSVGLLIMLIPSVVVGLLFCVYKGAGLLEVERTKCLEAGGTWGRAHILGVPNKGRSYICVNAKGGSVYVE